MEKLTITNIESQSFLAFLLWVLIIFSFFRILHLVRKKVHLPFFRSIAFSSPLFILESLAWIIFLLRSIFSYGKQNPIFSLALLGVFFLFSYFFVRYFLLGIVLGYTFRFQNKLLPGDQILYEGKKVVLKRYKLTVVEFITDDNMILQVSYHQLHGKVLKKSTESQRKKYSTLTIDVEPILSLEETKQRLKTYLLSLPYVKHNHIPRIENIDRAENKYNFKIDLVVLDQKYLIEIKNDLQDGFYKYLKKEPGK